MKPITAAVIFMLCLLAVPSPAFASVEPHATARIDGNRDFGYRIGDPIGLTIQIVEPQGVKVDIDSLTLSGDFELRGQPQVELSNSAGSTATKVRLRVQSFSAAPQLSARITFSYRVKGESEEKELLVPPVMVHTSRTWDGRMQLQGEEWNELPVSHWPQTVLVVLLGLAIGTYCGRRIAAIRRNKSTKETPEDVEARIRAQFAALYETLQKNQGQGEPELRALCGIIRGWYNMPALPLEFVPIQVQENDEQGIVTVALSVVERALFSGQPLREDDSSKLAQCAGKMFWKSLPPEEAEAAFVAIMQVEKEVAS